MTLFLAAMAFVVGKGIASATLPTHAGSAWLDTVPRGSVTLVDATTARPSAEITLPGTAGHRLQIAQDGDLILVYDTSTGVLTKIDSGQLTAGPARATTPGVRLVAGPKGAYLMDYGAGTVQRIDPATLQNTGPAVRIIGRLGTAGVDGQGTLWVPRSDDGVVLPVDAAGLGAPVDVRGRGSELAVSIVGGRPVVLDATLGRVSVVSTSGVEWSVTLPGISRGERLLAPATQDGTVLPVVARDHAGLILIDLSGRHVSRVPLDSGRHDVGAPVMNGDRAYVPDYGNGSVLVYSTARRTWEPSFPVTGRPGSFDILVKDGCVYFNDPRGPHAVVVGGDGTPHPVEKFTPGATHRKTPAQQLPGGPPKRPVPVRDPLPLPNGPSLGQPVHLPPDRPTRHRGPTSTPPTPTPPATTPSTPAPPPPKPPGAPRDVTAAPQPGGGVRVSWQAPANAPKGVGYVVSYSGATSGQVQTTSTVMTIDAGRLTFLDRYTFTVKARTSAGTSSGVSASARSGGDGQSFRVDVSKTRTDPNNPCLNLSTCRATMRQEPTHTSAQTGIAPQGATVTGFCHKNGQTIRNDDGAQSTEWVLIEYGGNRGYVSTLWLGGPSAYQRVWSCP